MYNLYDKYLRGNSIGCCPLYVSYTYSMYLRGNSIGTDDDDDYYDDDGQRTTDNDGRRRTTKIDRDPIDPDQQGDMYRRIRKKNTIRKTRYVQIHPSGYSSP